MLNGAAESKAYNMKPRLTSATELLLLITVGLGVSLDLFNDTLDIGSQVGGI
jgi:hypothetical protein